MSDIKTYLKTAWLLDLIFILYYVLISKIKSKYKFGLQFFPSLVSVFDAYISSAYNKLS